MFTVLGLFRLGRIASPALSRQTVRMATNGTISDKWQQPSTLPASERLVWVDCEMTGLDIDKDVLLEVAMIITEGDTLQVVAQSDSIIIHADDSVLDNMNEWCVKQHGQSGLTQACKDSKITVTDAENMLLKILREKTPKGKCPLAGNTVSADRVFLTKYMPTLTSHLHYRNVDVSTVKEMTRRWYPDLYHKAPRKKECHRALDDIEESIKELKYYKEAVFK